ncbi:MAG: type II toxin-antitoxin system PemK/MazF family toxin [Acidobacteria bacterium]|nr:type II toxin-antitoxin system PemK/MazF family toxin [Acidobacteriota bacterium]
MVVARGEVWWADLSAPRGSEPGFRRPVLVVQSDAFNRSRLPTVLVVSLTASLRLAEQPGNVLLPRESTGLPRDSVANLTQLATVDEGFLEQQAGVLSGRLMAQIDNGLRLVLDL